MTNIPWLVKNIRKELGLTQHDLAKTCGFHSQFISLVENGKSKLPLPVARKIMKKYKISQQDFVEAYVDDYREEIKGFLK